MEDYEVVINSTKQQIEDLKDSIIWADIKHELNMWIRGFELEREAIVDNASSENPSTASVLLHLGDLNGRKKAVIYMLGILDIFLEAKNESKHK